jgi:hypothetical protein
MGLINFDDHVLIKRQRVGKKMNETCGMFKDVKKWGSCQNQFVFVVGNYTRFQSFGVHCSVSAKNAIEKLQKIARDKEAQRSEHI